MNIYTIHGTCEHFEENRMIYRSYVPEKSFRTFLQYHAKPFTGWNSDKTPGDIITIDDSTNAGADACLLARNLGHEVILFINPYPIITGKPYFFSLLNCVLDLRTANTIEYQNKTYDLYTYSETHLFRKLLKSQLMIKQPDAAVTEVYEIAVLLKAKLTDIPYHLKPITIEKLLYLKNKGVQIESHGWSHVEISAFSKFEFLKDFQMTKDWIKQETGNSPKMYAAPFGETDYSNELCNSNNGVFTYFLATNKFPPGRIGPNCWNREDITYKLQKNKIV